MDDYFSRFQVADSIQQTKEQLQDVEPKPPFRYCRHVDEFSPSPSESNCLPVKS